MGINDVLPLKAARHDAHCELKTFDNSGHQRLNFDGSIYIRYATPLYSADTVIMASVYTEGSCPIFCHLAYENCHKISSLAPQCLDGERLKFLTYVCKSGSLANMSQIVVEFCLLTSVCEAWK